MAANFTVAHYGLAPVGFGLMAPAGVYVAGLAFTFRDAVHERFGWRGAAVAVVAGSALSVAISPALAVASGTAFLFSEMADLAVYEPLRSRGLLLAVAASNVVGLLVDSALFLWLAFGSFDFMAGQVVGKLWATAAALVFIAARRRWVR